MKVRLLMIAEIEVPEQDNEYTALHEARDRLDAFRESVRPSQEYGIFLYRTRGLDTQHEPWSEQLVNDGWDILEETPSKPQS